MATASVLEDEILTLLDADAVVRDAACMRKLVDLLPRVESTPEVTMLLVVLTKAPPLLLGEFVRAGGVRHLKAWLNKYSKSKDRDAAAVLRDLLKVILVLPVTFEVVQSTEIGKAVSRISHRRPDTTHSDPGWCTAPCPPCPHPPSLLCRGGCVLWGRGGGRPTRPGTKRPPWERTTGREKWLPRGEKKKIGGPSPPPPHPAPAPPRSLMPTQ
jgi:hypothetical protein